MTKAKPKGILYIERTKLDIYIDGTSNIASFLFTPDTVKDLEIVNKEEFTKQLSNFIKENHFTPCSLVVIFSDNVLFTKNYTSQNSNYSQRDIEEFLNEVPFDKVNSKIYNLPGGELKIIAINQDFFELIKVTFQLFGFTVDGGLPVSIFDIKLGNNNFDLNTAQTIISQIEELNQFTIDLEKNEINQPLISSQDKKIKRPRPFFILLLSILLILLGVLTVLIMKR